MPTFAIRLITMKQLLIVAAAAMAFGTASAQKVDLDPFNFKFEYRNLPHSVVDSTLKTFQVNVDISGRMANAMSADNIANAINVQGLTREDDADVIIEIRYDDIIIESSKVNESYTETKSKEGNVTRTYSYTPYMEYSVSGRASVKHKNGSDILANVAVFSSRTGNWSGKSYSSRSDAQNFLYNNKVSIINGIIRNKLDESIGNVNRKVNYEMGFPAENDNYFFWLIDNKKHPEHDAMAERWTALKPVLQGISASDLTDEDRSKLKVMIDYFDKLKTTYNKDEKGDKKIRYACFYNNALLYMFLDQPENAMKEADALVANDYDAKDGKKLKEQAQELQALFEKNNIYTRHFPSNQRPWGKK